MWFWLFVSVWGRWGSSWRSVGLIIRPLVSPLCVLKRPWPRCQSPRTLKSENRPAALTLTPNTPSSATREPPASDPAAAAVDDALRTDSAGPAVNTGQRDEAGPQRARSHDSPQRTRSLFSFNTTMVLDRIRFVLSVKQLATSFPPFFGGLCLIYFVNRWKWAWSVNVLE